MSLPRDLGESHQSAILQIFARQGTPRMKKISSFFDAFPSRKRPATAKDPKADLQCSQEDNVMQHEEKKEGDQR